jgi:hypothetical protein
MQIRIRGSKLQMLRRVKKDVNIKKYLTVASVPSTLNSFEEIDENVLKVLTRREQGQLEEYIERKAAERNSKLKPHVFDLNVIPDSFLEKMRKLVEDDGLCIEVILAAIAIATSEKGINAYAMDKIGCKLLFESIGELKKVLKKMGYTKKSSLSE